MHLHLALQPPDVVLQLAAGCIECISDGDVGIFMPPRSRRVVADVDMLAAGHRHMDANGIGIALVMAMLGTRDHHARRRDAIVEALEPLRLLAHGRLEGIGMPDVLEHDLEGHLH